MIWNILTIVALVFAAAGLWLSLYRERRNNRCDGCSLREECHRNEKKCPKSPISSGLSK